ncbi:MAG TPA: acylphosphatase [Actinobacteria bacterium]|nr:acylphosphatase [Actinomycetota bacterium]
MSKIRAKVKVEGRVHGVYYRSYTKDIAENVNVTGWVKNLSDGSVEMVLEGDEDDVREVIRWSYQGPPAAKVVNVTVNWENYSGEFEDFKVKYW